MEAKRKMTASDPVVGAAGKRSSYVKHYREIITEIRPLFNDFAGNTRTFLHWPCRERLRREGIH